MPHIMEQGRDTHDSSVFFRQLAARHQQFDNPTHDPENAERVRESRMGSVGIHERRQTKLLQVPKPLKRRRVDQLPLQRADSDVAMHRIANHFVPEVFCHLAAAVYERTFDLIKPTSSSRRQASCASLFRPAN